MSDKREISAKLKINYDFDSFLKIQQSRTKREMIGEPVQEITSFSGALYINYMWREIQKPCIIINQLLICDNCDQPFLYFSEGVEGLVPWLTEGEITIIFNNHLTNRHND